MKAKKILIVVGIIILVGAIVGFTVTQTQKNVVTVQTGKVMKQDITSLVTASGETKPKTFVNVGANAFGRITRLYVKEGEKVKRGQLLAQLENVQSAADVENMKASLASSQTDALASDAAINTASAQLKSSTADLARTKLDYDRAENLYKNNLISRQITIPRGPLSKWPRPSRHRTRHAWRRQRRNSIRRKATFAPHALNLPTNKIC